MSLPDEVHLKDIKDADLSSTSSESHHAIKQNSRHQYFSEKSFGIRREEILTMQLESNLVRVVYFFTILVGMFVTIIENKCTSVFIGYATDSYAKHSLLSTITVVRGVIAAAALPAFARVSDLFGRFPIFLVAMVSRIVGLIVMSQATNVHRYAGGMVLYSIGFAGARILYQFNLQDASTLKYRLLSVALLNVPVIITTWASGEIVTSLLNNHGWSFGIALWAFTSPLSSLPYMACSGYMYWKAAKTNAWKQLNEERRMANVGKSLRSRFVAKSVEVFWKADLVGCFLVICFLGLILVPLTLAGGESKKWKEAHIIAPFVVGFVCIPIFCFWESKMAKHPLCPVVLLKDRGIWGAFSIGVWYTFASNLPTAYSYAVLLVGMNASTTVATRTPQLLSFVQALAIPALGYVVSKVRRTKGFIMGGSLLWFVAMGLLVHFRGDSDGVSGKYYRDGVAAGVCVLGLGISFISRPVSISAQTCTNHEYMATVTAMFAALYQAGSAVGDCVSGAIWTQTMYDKIKENMVKLGVDPKLATTAYASPYKFIKTYKWGSQARIAVVLAYASVQRYLCIVGLCLCVPLFLFTFVLRDHYLEDMQSLEDVVDEKGGIRREGQILFTDDDDKILNFIKRVFGIKSKKGSEQLSV